MKKSLSNGVIIWLVLSSGILAFIDPFQTQMAFAQLVNSTSTNSTSTTLTNSTNVNLTNSTLSLTNSTNITTTNSTLTTTNSTTNTQTTEPIVQEPIIIEETTPAPPPLPTGPLSISRYTQPTDSYVDLVKTSYGSNYNLVENYNIGEATWTSTQPRILKDGVWVNYALKQYDQKIEIYSNSVGTIIYDLPTCSYSIYENGYNGQNIIPSVSAVATANINGVWQNLEVNKELCSVNVVENLNGATITATKTLTETVTENNLVNGTSSSSLVNTQTFVHEIQFDVNKGIKETFKVWNVDDVELGISQTVHTGESITVGQNTIDIAQANGQSFDKAFLEANEAQVFEIADGLNYDFDLGFDSLSNINIFFDGDYKVNLDYADGGFVNYLEIDPTISLSSTVYGRTVTTTTSSGGTCSTTFLQTTLHTYIQRTTSATNQGCQAVYWSYDISSIDDSATITSANFEYTVNAVYNSPPAVTWRELTTNPPDGQTTVNDAISGTAITSSDTGAQTTGSKTIALNSNALNGIQNKLSSDYYALAGYYTDQTRDGTERTTEFATSSSLEITYTVPTIPQPPTNLVATDGLPIGLSYSVPSDDGYGNSNGAELLGYKVYRADNPNAQLELPDNGGSNGGLDFTDNELLLHGESFSGLPDFEDDYSTYTTQSEANAVWETWRSTRYDVNLSTDQIDINVGVYDSNRPSGNNLPYIGSTNCGICTDLGLLDNNQWVIRFKTSDNTWTTPPYYDITFYWVVSDSSNNMQSSQDVLGMAWRNNVAGGAYAPTGQQTGIVYQDGSNPWTTSTGGIDQTFTTLTTGQTYYHQLTRESATSFKVEIFSDSEYSTSIRSTTVTIPSTIQNLQWLKFLEADDDGNGGGFRSKIDDVKVWNGVNSVPTPTATDNSPNTLTVTANSGTTTTGFIDNGISAPNLEVTSSLLPDATDSFTVGSWVKQALTRDSTFDGIGNPAPTTGTTGKIGNAWTFDAVDDKVTLGGTTADWKFLSTDNNSWTISLWFKNLGTWANGKSIISTVDGSANQGMVIDIRTGGDIRLLENYNSGTNMINNVFSVGISDANYHHYVMTYNDATSTAQLFVDGVSKGTVVANLPSTGNPNVVAELGDSTYVNAINSEYDQLLIYKRVLSTQEISDLYNSGSGSSNVPTTDLFAHYDFEQTGSTLENQVFNPPTNTKLFGFTNSNGENISFDVGTTTASFDKIASGSTISSTATASPFSSLGGGSGSGYTKVGMEVFTGHPLVGQDLETIQLKLSKSGTVSGNGYVSVYDSSGNLKSSSTNTYSLSGLPAYPNPIYYTFTFSPPQSIANGDRIVIEGGTFNNSNQVDVFGQNTVNPDPYTNGIMYENGWTTVSGLFSNSDLHYIATTPNVPTTIISATGLADNTSAYHHYALTRDGSSWTLYQDGSSVATATDSTDLGSVSSTSRNSSLDGTKAGSTVSTSTGKVGTYAGDFSGTGTVDFTAKHNLHQNSQYSIAFWLNVDTYVNNGIIFDDTDFSSANIGIGCRTENTNQIYCAEMIGSAGNNYWGLMSTTGASTGTWYHYVITVDGGNVATMYRNGQSVVTDTSFGTKNTNPSSYNFRMGDGANGNDNNYDGKIDQLVMYDRILSGTEISDLYNLGSGTTTVPTNGLVAHWDFEQTGSTLENQTYLTTTNPHTINIDGSIDEYFIDSTALTSAEINNAYDRAGTFTFLTNPNQATYAQVPLPDNGGADAGSTGDEVDFTDNELLIHGYENDGTIQDKSPNNLSIIRPITNLDEMNDSNIWTKVGTDIQVTGGKIVANFNAGSDHRVIKDVGLLSDTFVAHFDFKAIYAPVTPYWTMFAFTSDTGLPRGTNDGVYGLIDMGNWSVYLRNSDGTTDYSTQTGSIQLTAGNQYYVTYTKDYTVSPTTHTLKIYSDSARTTQVGSTISASVGGTITGLQYFQTGRMDGANAGGPVQYEIDNLSITDGTTTYALEYSDSTTTGVISNAISTPNLSVTSSLLPDATDSFTVGSWVKLTQINQQDTNNFSTDNMVDSDSSRIGITGGEFKVQLMRDGSNDASTWTLANTYNNKFNMKFEFKTDGLNGYPSGYVGLFDQDNTVGTTTGGQDFVTLLVNDLYNIKLVVGDNTSMYGGTPTQFASWYTLPSTNTYYFIEIIGNGDDTYTMNVRSGSHTGTLLTSQTVTQSGVTGLNYWGAKNTISSGTSGTIVTVDNLDISYTEQPTNTKLLGFTNSNGEDVAFNVGTTTADFGLSSVGTVVVNEDMTPTQTWNLSQAGGNAVISNGEMTYRSLRTTSNQAIGFQLPNTLDNTNGYIVRFSIEKINENGNQGRAFIGVAPTSWTTIYGSTTRGAYLSWHDSNTIHMNEIISPQGTSGGSGLGSQTLSSNTPYYFEFVFDPVGDNFIGKVFSDSGFSNQLGTASTTNADNQTPFNADYFVMWNPDWSTDGHWKEFVIDDIQICDGYTSWSNNCQVGSTTTIISATGLTDNTSNFQHYALTRDGSSWTLYQNGASVATATDSTDLGSASSSGGLTTDFASSTGWTTTDSNYLTVGSGTLNWNMKRDGSNDSLGYDLGSTLPDDWTMRFKVTQGSSIGATQAGNGFFFGISDSNQSVGQSTSQDFVGMAYYYDNQSQYNALDSDGTALPHLYQGDAVQNINISTNSVFYFEVIKTGSSYTVEAFTNSDYSTGSLGKLSGTTTATGLRYVKILNELTNGVISTSTNPFNGTIDDLSVSYTVINPHTINIDGSIDEYFIDSTALSATEIQNIDARGEVAYPYTTTSLTFNDNTVVSGEDYAYRVSALNDIGESATYSNIDSAMTVSPANAPTNLTATLTQNIEGSLNWTPSTDLGNGNLLKMRIERVTNGGAWNLVTETTSTSPPYVDTTISGGNTYIYRVASVNEAGTGDWSNNATLDTSCSVQPAYCGNAPSFSQALGKINQFILNWEIDNGTGVSGYRIENSSDGLTWSLYSQVPNQTISYTTATDFADNEQVYWRIWGEPFDEVNSLLAERTTADEVNNYTLNYPSKPLITNILLTGADAYHNNIFDIEFDNNTIPSGNWDFTGGDAITDFRLRVENIVNQSGWIDWVTNSSLVEQNGKYVFNSTELGTSETYNVQISVANDVDWSDWSDNYTRLTTYPPPTIVENFQSIPTNENQIDLIWKTVLDDGGSLTKDYEIRYLNNTNNDVMWSTLVSNSSLQYGADDYRYHNHTLINPAINFTYSVREGNYAGWSDWSMNMSAVTFEYITAILTAQESHSGDAINMNGTWTMTEGVDQYGITAISYEIINDTYPIRIFPLNITPTKGENVTIPLEYLLQLEPNLHNLKFRINLQNSTGVYAFDSPILSVTPAYQAQYVSSVEGNYQVNYTHDRNNAGTSLELVVNRPTAPFQVECNFKSELFEDGDWQNLTDLGYYNVSQNVKPTRNVYIQCYNDELLFTTVSYGQTNATLALTDFTDQLGSFFGVPLPFLFVIFLAAIFTGRSAPTGIIFLAASIGVMGVMGYFPDPTTGENMITATVWGMLILITGLGIFMGKRFF